MLWCGLLASCALHLVVAHENPHQPEQPLQGAEVVQAAESPVEDIRKRWTAIEVMHDLNHIKEDLSMLVDLQETGEITKDEASFYYFRMHDFDNNHFLDGQEIMAGMIHSLEHRHDGPEEPGGKNLDFERVIALTDESLLYDTNNDGLISYPEMRSYVQDKMH
ncbi:multiple coagulation factor deficiency protein 2 homolog [Ornithodoros turicata]|uniref:multiple coagulation factor deficiency protein 2 homolog n=1 Tax=Ornithodoros turicata TaxID=34597 RepID=UPI0031393408